MISNLERADNKAMSIEYPERIHRNTDNNGIDWFLDLSIHVYSINI